VIKLAYGTVLEIGPGSGEWIRQYDKTQVTKIYGVEPNKDHHESLRKKAKEAGLADVYVIIPVGVEELGDKWIGLGEVDCVVTVSSYQKEDPFEREIADSLVASFCVSAQFLTQKR
jgi:cyclopropane fatty-acyl-phospholipid synthase-like methyltransferase